MSRARLLGAVLALAPLVGCDVATGSAEASATEPGTQPAPSPAPRATVPDASPAPNPIAAETLEDEWLAKLADLTAERDALRGELTLEREDLARLRNTVDRLQGELAAERARRSERELEWLEFTRALSVLPVPEATQVPDRPAFLPEPEPTGPTDAELAAAAELEARAMARVERARNDLNALLIAEHVGALDFMELGRVHDGWAGPVVVRLLDDRGRLVGTLAADRLRLEASRAGRSVTLVFEVGWESRGGVRVPFGPPETEGGVRGGRRRIQLPGVDPVPWIERLPELLDPADLRPTPDDGRWNLIELRLVVDERLRIDSPGGRWRMVAVGGVVGGELMDVHLAELEQDGGVVRRLFADSLRVRPRGRGLELVLEDGVIQKDGEKTPFLDGRYRLFLPDAQEEVWERAGVPGLSRPPKRAHAEDDE